MRKQFLMFVVAGLGPAVGSARGDMLVQYLFSEGSGTSVANTGTAGAAGNLTFGGSPAPVFSLANFTPSGAGYSMDNTASSAGSGGGYAQTASSFDVLDNLSQATITGWFNLQAAAGLSRLVDRADNSVGSDQWSLYLDGDVNKLQLNLGGTSYVSNPMVGTDAWVYFAVVINENDGGNKIKFYAGDVANAASLKGNLASSSSGLGDNSKKLTIGNRESGSRAFDGYLWDVRIYNEALTDTAVEGIRASAIPEPGLLAVTVLPALGLLRRRRRND